MNPDYHFGRCRSGRVRDADVHTLAEPKATYRAELHAVLHDVRAGAFDDAIEVESFWRCLGRSIVAEGSERCCVVKEDSALCDAYAGELLIGRQHRLQRDIDRHKHERSNFQVPGGAASHRVMPSQNIDPSNPDGMR